jgi:uncharacterized protein YdcH (DUF465 family)
VAGTRRKSSQAAKAPFNGAVKTGKFTLKKQGGTASMSHVAHELHEEFPEQAEAIHALKANNAHFARIAEDYHMLNRAIHRMETNVEPADDATMEDLKKQRLVLKDEIAGFLATA